MLVVGPGIPALRRRTVGSLKPYLGDPAGRIAPAAGARAPRGGRGARVTRHGASLESRVDAPSVRTTVRAARRAMTDETECGLRAAGEREISYL